MDRLLQDGTGRVDPSADNNYAIRFASFYGHIAVVDRLLQEGRVDPSADDIITICCDGRVISSEAISAFGWASICGHIAVVERLLQDGRVDSSVIVKYANKLVFTNSHIAVMDRFGHELNIRGLTT